MSLLTTGGTNSQLSIVTAGEGKGGGGGSGRDYCAKYMKSTDHLSILVSVNRRTQATLPQALDLNYCLELN